MGSLGCLAPEHNLSLCHLPCALTGMVHFWTIEGVLVTNRFDTLWYHGTCGLCIERQVWRLWSLWVVEDCSMTPGQQHKLSIRSSARQFKALQAVVQYAVAASVCTAPGLHMP